MSAIPALPAIDLPALVAALAAVPPDQLWHVVGAVVVVVLAVALPVAWAIRRRSDR